MSRMHHSLSYKNENGLIQVGGAIVAQNGGSEFIVGICNTKEAGTLITPPVFNWLHGFLDDDGYVLYEKNCLGAWQLLTCGGWEDSSSDSLEDKFESLISDHAVDQKQIDETQEPDIVLMMPSKVNPLHSNHERISR